MNILTVIPTRAGSIGVSNKNLLNIAGKSMLERTLDYLRTSKFDMDIIAVTNDPLGKAEAEAAGLLVVDEPEELAKPDVISSYSVQYATKYAIEHFNMAPDCVMEFQVNVPVRPPGIVDQAIQMFIDSAPDVVVTFTKCDHAYHPMFIWSFDDEGRATKSFDIPAVSRQLAKASYCFFNGVVMLFDTQSLLSASQSSRRVHIYSALSHVVGFHIGEFVEIDSSEDVRRAEDFFRQRGKPDANCLLDPAASQQSTCPE